MLWLYGSYRIPMKLQHALVPYLLRSRYHGSWSMYQKHRYDQHFARVPKLRGMNYGTHRKRHW